MRGGVVVGVGDKKYGKKRFERLIFRRNRPVAQAVAFLFHDRGKLQKKSRGNNWKGVGGEKVMAKEGKKGKGIVSWVSTGRGK